MMTRFFLPLLLCIALATRVCAVDPTPTRPVTTDSGGNPTTPFNLGGSNLIGKLSSARLPLGTTTGNAAAGVAVRSATEGTVTQFGSVVALTDRFDTTSAGGTFATNPLGQVTATGGAADFSTALVVPIPFVRENWTASLDYVMGTLTSTSNGPALTIGTLNPYANYAPYSICLDTSTDSSNGVLQVVSGGGATVLATNNSSGMTVAAGDVVRQTISRHGVTLLCKVENLTHGTSRSAVFISNLQSSTPNFVFPNTSHLAIYYRGGTVTFTDFRMTSESLAAPDLFVVGDSKAFGASAGILAGRWASIVAFTGGYTLRVEAGGGDRTVEAVQTIPLLNLAPRYCINALGFNDIASGVASAMWQANYQTITTHMLAWGGKVYHLLPIPSSSTDTSALRAWQIATYPGLTIDPAVGFNTSTMLDPDGTHPNALGHQHVASIVSAFLAANP